MFGYFVVGLFFGVPVVLLCCGRSTAQVYFFSWLMLIVALAVHSFLRGIGDISLTVISVVAASILSLIFTSFVLFGYWIWEQIRRT